MEAVGYCDVTWALSRGYAHWRFAETTVGACEQALVVLSDLISGNTGQSRDESSPPAATFQERSPNTLRSTNRTFAGRSASRRMKYGYHSVPYGT